MFFLQFSFLFLYHENTTQRKERASLAEAFFVNGAYENCSYCVRKLLILRQKILPEKKIKSYYVFKFSLTLAKKNLSRKFSEIALKKIFALRVFCFFAKSF